MWWKRCSQEEQRTAVALTCSMAASSSTVSIAKLPSFRRSCHSTDAGHGYVEQDRRERATARLATKILRLTKSYHARALEMVTKVNRPFKKAFFKSQGRLQQSGVKI